MALLDRVLRRRSYYRSAFQGDTGRAVLADLKRFCRWGQNPMVLGLDRHTDLYATGVAAGRQEVFQRIIGHLEVDDADLLRLKEATHDDE